MDEEVQLSGFGVQPFPHITMDFVVGEPLDLFLKTPGKKDGARFCSIIASVGMSLIKLHKKGIAHGFLETKSIIIGDGSIPRIAGYGFCRNSSGLNLENMQYQDIRALGRITLQIASGLISSGLPDVENYSGDKSELKAIILEKLKGEETGTPVRRLCHFGIDCLTFDGSSQFSKLVASLKSD
jgi:serine/threonine protein kinase